MEPIIDMADPFLTLPVTAATGAMGVHHVLLTLLFIVMCGALMAVILLQKKKASGFGSVAGLGQTDSYWDKNKGRSMEGTLEKWTKIGGVVFFVSSFLMCLV